MTAAFVCAAAVLVLTALLRYQRLPGRRAAKWALILVIVPVVAGALGLLRPAPKSTVPPSLTSPAAGYPRPSVAPAELDSGLRAVADGERGVSRDHWDPAYVVGQVGRDPQALYRWVRNSTVPLPYQGVLRGPVGVLLDREGNSLDRALLLATLLQQAGHTVRLARADLTRAQAFALVPALLARSPAEPLLQPTSADDSTLAREVRAAAARYGWDTLVVERRLIQQSASMTRTRADLNARAADQALRLRVLLPGVGGAGDRRARVNAAIDALTDHWWVQRQNGEDWINLDPDIADDSLAGAIDVPRSTPGTMELDSTLYHQIVVRLVTERWAGGAVQERKALETVVRSADAIGRTITLQVWPQGWPAKSLLETAEGTRAFRSTALAQRAWRATLFVGSDVAADAIIGEDGGTRSAAAGGPLGGLGRGITEGIGESNSGDALLTAAWLEYEIRVPGKPPRTARRVLFDLLGASARAAHQVAAPEIDDRAKLTRSLALMRSTEILPVASKFAPEFLIHRASETLLHNGAVVRPAISDQGSDMDGVVDLAAQVEPIPSTLYAIALARFVGPSAKEVYIEQPNILTRHVFPAPAGFPALASRIVLKEAVDIVANDVGVSLTTADAIGARLRQGVFDTDAEALVPSSGKPSESVGEIFSTSNGWIALSTLQDARLSTLQVSADVRQRIADDLKAGYVVVAPTAPVRTGSADFFGWWRIDPATGQTLGVSANGWGQSLAERAMLVGAAFVAGYTFEYLLCEGLLNPYGANKTDISSRSRTLLDALATPAAAQPASMAASKECRLQALISGAIGAGVQFLGVTWDLVRLTVLRSRLAAFLVGEVPLLQTGPVEPGDLPPLFGPKPPAPDCPGGGAGTSQAAGAAVDPLGKTQPASEPVNPLGETPPAGEPVNPLGETQPASPPAGQPQATPGEAQPGGSATAGEAAPTGEADGVGFYWNEDGDLEMLPAKPEYFERELARNARLQPAAESKFDDAVQANSEAQQNLRSAESRYNKAVQEHPNGSPEENDARKALDEAETASRQAARAVRHADRNVKAGESQETYLRRLQAANERYRQALNDKAAADQEFASQLENGKGFDGPEYKTWKQATNQYEAARKDFYSAVKGGRSSLPPPAQPSAEAPGGPGATEAMPNRPGAGPTQQMPNRPIPGPGATQPMANSPPIPGPGPTLPLGNSPTLPACGSAGGPAPADPTVTSVVGGTQLLGSAGGDLVGPSKGEK